MNSFYTQYADKWRKAEQNVTVLTQPLQAVEYENAVVLPLRRRADSAPNAVNGWHEGGVCTKDMEFVAGLDRKYPRADENWCCIRGYEPETVTERDETVIYGGVLINHFGHMLVDCLSRMWYFAKNPDTPHKFVFLMMTEQYRFFKDFFALAGLTEDRYEIITKPTRFAKVIVPDQAIFSLSSVAHPDWLLFFDRIKENVGKTLPKPEFDKVYLTRTQLPPEKRFELNEVWYEDFYREQGYTVVAPEQRSLAEQINIICNAREIATTMGTLTHMLLFARKDVKATFLLRSPEAVVMPQLIVDRLRGYPAAYIEATNNLLPSSHARGVPLYFPTAYFEKYLQHEKIPYDKERIQPEMSDALIGEYVRKYVQNYRVPQAYKQIASLSALDYVCALNQSLYGVTLDRKKFQAPRNMTPDQELQFENELLKAEMRKIKSSVSWKLTAPLRKVKKLFSKGTKKLKRIAKKILKR